ncbi:hypothetical protein ACWDZ8_25295 [Streptomyces sp. NPDC003233]
MPASTGDRLLLLTDGMTERGVTVADLPAPFHDAYDEHPGTCSAP